MRGSIIKKFLMILMSVSIVSFLTICYAHSGRTDGNGGHRDNKNKSGLGSYHYHCGGYPAHLHENGYCPFEYNEEEWPIDESENIWEPIDQPYEETIDIKEETLEEDIIEIVEEPAENEYDVADIIIEIRKYLFERILKMLGTK